MVNQRQERSLNKPFRHKGTRTLYYEHRFGTDIIGCLKALSGGNFNVYRIGLLFVA